MFTDLFNKIRQERLAKISEPSRVKELESKVIELESKVIQSDSKVVELEAKLKETESNLVQVEAFKRVYDEDRKCPYCKIVMENPRAMVAHKGHCLENPINKSKALNGVKITPQKVNGVKRVFGGG